MSDPVVLDLVTTEATIPAPDMLCVGPKGVHHTDIVKLMVKADAAVKRGTLLALGTITSGEGESATTEAAYIPALAADLDKGTTFVILADDAELEVGQYIEIAAYFEGDFNENAVIFAWETEEDDHAEIVETAREPLRRQKIFLRPVQK